MCGFVVVVQKSGEPLLDKLGLALAELRHRGPDGRNTWQSPDGRCAMGFHRLALVGPTHETQPFASEDGSIQVVVNGEIYGHAALRRELQAEGASFKTQSDCEVLLHGYRLHGIEYAARLNGEFAAVIWDGAQGQLYAVRDRWGVKPLYVRRHAAGVQLASELKALFALEPRPAWDRSALFQHFFASIGPSQTLFRGFEQVPPGHVLRWNAHGNSVTPLTAQQPTGPAAGPAAPELMKSLGSALNLAVLDRLHGDAPVACYLSGGVDSATMAALLARHANGPVDAFTVDFEDGGTDSAHAAQIAASLGLRHHVLRVGASALVENFGAAVKSAETIGFNAIGSARWMLSRFLSQAGYKAVLVGDGADELFGGYSFSVMDSLCHQSAKRAAHAQSLLSQGRAALAAEMGRSSALFDTTGLGFADGICPYLLTSWNYHRSEFRQFLSADFQAEFAHANPFAMLLAQIGEPAVRERQGLQKSLYLWQKSLFVNHILVSERLDMAHGVESRYPFLDGRVAAVAAATPDEWLVNDLREKWLLRQAMRDLTPEIARRSEKRPFAAPLMCAGEDAGFFTYLADTINSRAARESSVLDQNALLDLLKALPSLSFKARERLDGLLMMALSFLELGQCLGVAD